MTDKEIYMLIERCDNCGKHTMCPLVDKTIDCRDLQSIFDLIKRQQEDIEHFADIGKMYSEIRAEARAEAIKEFADRLKPEFQFESEYYNYCYVIDDLVKEMVGGKQ